jgi:hypothetical protein
MIRNILFKFECIISNFWFWHIRKWLEPLRNDYLTKQELKRRNPVLRNIHALRYGSCCYIFANDEVIVSFDLVNDEIKNLTHKPYTLDKLLNIYCDDKNVNEGLLYISQVLGIRDN